jgi:hypothetical protein
MDQTIGNNITQQHTISNKWRISRHVNQPADPGVVSSTTTYMDGHIHAGTIVRYHDNHYQHIHVLVRPYIP